MDDFPSAALGAIFGVITGLSLEWWKSGREDLTVMGRSFCDVVAHAADVGSEFRLTDPTERQADLLAARLVGFQRRISGYNAALIGRLHLDASKEITDNLGTFFTALTGGDFGEPTRKVSKQAAFDIQDRAAVVILSIRTGAYEKSSFKENFFRRIGKSWPNSS